MSRQSHNYVHPQSILWCLSHFCCCVHRSLTFTIFCQTDPYSWKSVKVTLCFSKFTVLWACSSLTKLDLSFLIWKKLHFVLYGKLHMPNIPVRLGGNYHDLHEAHSSVSRNHTAGLLQRKTSRANWLRRNESNLFIQMKFWCCGSWREIFTADRIELLRSINVVTEGFITTEMSGFQNSLSCLFSTLVTSSVPPWPPTHIFNLSAMLQQWMTVCSHLPVSAVVRPVASFCTYPFFIRHLCVL